MKRSAEDRAFYALKAKAFRKRREASGTCHSCPEPAREDKRQCQACADRNQAQVSARVAARRAAGKCAYCGKPSSDAFLCERHQSKRRLAAKLRA